MKTELRSFFRRPAPSLRFRLLSWFVVYFLGSILCIGLPTSIKDLGTYCLGIPWALALFPGGFVEPFAPIVAWGIRISGPGFAAFFHALAFLFLLFGYVLYALHLKLTWKAPDQKAFIRLMLFLAIIVSFNLACCDAMWREHEDNKMKHLVKEQETL